jgi:hypothetical protein
MTSRRNTRLAFALLSLLPLLAHAACSSGNGDAIGNQMFDASPLDPGSKPDDPDGGPGQEDASPKKDADPPQDAPSDAPLDAPNTAPVQINEVYVDNAFLRGDATEYIELRAAPGTRVDDLKLRIVYSNGNGAVKYEIAVGDPGEKFGANGLWVVGGMQTFKLNVLDHVDQPLSAGVFGLDDRGAVQLVRGSTLLDVVGYGDDPDAGAVPVLLTPPTATSEGKISRTAIQPASSSAPAKSIGRKTAAADTNNNSADFCQMVASPGFAQKPCE